MKLSGLPADKITPSILLFGCSAKYAGIFTLLSYTICPSYLAIKSRYVVQESELPVETHYKTLFSRDAVAWALIVLASSLIIGVFVEAVLR